MKVNVLAIALLFSAIFTHAHAGEPEQSLRASTGNANVLSRNGLPACAQTVMGGGAAPNWVVRNECGGPILIEWCWFKSFPNWKNAENSCAKTGVRASGAVGEGELYEFPDRPHSDANAQFPIAAALTVTRVCRVDKTGHCPDR